jgi:hypothetical protein
LDALLGPMVHSYSSRQHGSSGASASASSSSGWVLSRLGRPLAEVPVSAVRAVAQMVSENCICYILALYCFFN